MVDAAGLEAVLGEERWSWAEVELRAAIADAASDAGVATGPPRLAMAGVAVDGPIAVETGGTGLAIGLALGVALTIGDSGSPTIGRDGLTAESTTERTENGERTTARITGTIGVPAGEGTISADVQFGVEVSVFDAATGALKSTTSFSTTGTVKIETCPDVNGKVHGHVSLAVSGSAGGASASVTVEADVVGTVDDSATLTTLDLDGTTTDSTTSASGVTTGSTASGGGRLLVGRGGSLTPDDSRAHGTLERDTADLTDDQVTDRYRRIGAAAGLAAFLIGGKAQEKWRGGKCVEIRLTEQSRGVKRNQHVPFEASVWHKIERRQLTKPIVAAFAGEASVDPVDVALPSPVTYDFKASSKARKTGPSR